MNTTTSTGKTTKDTFTELNSLEKSGFEPLFFLLFPIVC